MNNKRFDFKEKDLPFLKKDTVIKLIFAIAFFVVFAWQLGTFIACFVNHSWSILKIILASIVLVCSLMLFIVLVCLIASNKKISKLVKEKGKCKWEVPFIYDNKKDGFMNMYKIAMLCISIITIVILLASLIVMVVKKSYVSTTGFYLPLLFLICLCGLNTFFYIRSTEYMQKLVREQNFYVV